MIEDGNVIVNNNKAFEVVVGKVLGKANTDVDKLEYLEDLVDLEPDYQLEAFKILWLALRNVIYEKVVKGEFVNFPYLGQLKIKVANKIANNKRKEVAIKLGYNDWNSIPKDKIEQAAKEVKELTNSELMARKKSLNGMPNRKANYQPEETKHLKLPKKLFKK